MPSWTKEQSLAIEKSGSNIIVSAGAGSGKTAVLSERVLTKLNNGIHIGELLILTFTRAAAEEMKNRIRKNIKKNPSLKSEADGLDSAYITTFDSFALSVVKKYHYLLNIPADIAITDDSIVRIEKRKIMDEVFEQTYLAHDKNFENFVKKYCIKSDASLRKDMSTLADKLENYIDKDDFINTLIDKFFSNENLDFLIEEYGKFIEEKKKNVSIELENMHHYFESDYISKVEELVLPILNTKTLDDFVCYTNIKLPPVPRGTIDIAKEKKANLKSSLDELISFTSYGNSEVIKVNILSTKPVVTSIIGILKEYFKKLDMYKKDNGIYTFQDIALLAIRILDEHENARLELKNTFKEIMIDEYQDTNDIQEAFISKISNNNVYMVGDIKQSIYRFRGSNPIIFKDKYDNYSKENGGFKIDLIKNFRSRSEVLTNINRMFDLLMDNDLGGAEYYESHEMVYGNTAYDEQRVENIDYNLEILEYENPKDSEYSNFEVEIFAIANDIKKKTSSGMQVFDKETSCLRPIKYSDFVIILDRSKFFDDFKKIFEYLDIPLTILKDGKLNASTDIYLIRNIVDIILRIKSGDFGTEFRFDFLSIGRSFLYEYTDEYLFDILNEKRYNETKLYEDFKNISSFNSKTSSMLFDEILDITSFYDKLNKIGDYENINVRLSTISSIAENLETIGLTIEGFRDYLDEILENDYEIKYTEWNSSTDSVNILTIHKSKGLEYPICYFADLDHEFNVSELKSKFICDKEYGLIVPVDSEDSKDSIVKLLYKNAFMKQEISEKIRLFYVALTRAREKMIIVLPSKESEKLEKNRNGTIELVRRLKFTKLSDFVYPCKPYMREYFKNIKIEDLGLTKNYLYNKDVKSEIDRNAKKEFVVDEISIQNELLEQSHFSKAVPNLITKENHANMDFGTKVHEALEYIDFKNFDASIIENTFIREKVEKFLKTDLLVNIKNAEIYKEHEFYYTSNDTDYHGIIDLMLEYEDHIDIIDYKLKNIDDVHYIDQLNGYKEYITQISNKSVNTYLYSIIDETVKEIG